MRKLLRYYRPLLLLMATVLCWSVPLLRVLHVEAGIVFATLLFFLTALGFLTPFRQQAPFLPRLREAFLLTAIPFAGLTLTLLWTPNCDYLRGAGLFLTYTLPSALLGTALSYGLSTFPRIRHWHVAFMGLLLLVLPPLYDLGFHPQFYTYNHVFGGVLNPIYDEELVIRPGFFLFRGLTLLWALVLFGIGYQRRKGSLPRWWFLLPAGLLFSTILYADRLGFVTSFSQLTRALPVTYTTRHALLHTAAPLDSAKRQFLTSFVDYHIRRLQRLLHMSPPENIHIFLYPDDSTRARLTGARRTSVAPVWLSPPQAHILLNETDTVLPHELVHLFSRSFGLPLLRLSVAPGLLEGLAVALEPPDGLPPAHAQMAAFLQEAPPQIDSSLIHLMALQLSPLGFWTQQATRAYTLNGSFVRFLFETWGVPPLKKAYARASFAPVYHLPLHELTSRWISFVRTFPTDSLTRQLVAHRFNVPPLFFKPCPHYTPPYLVSYRRAMRAIEARDTLRAIALLQDVLYRAPSFTPALQWMARYRWQQGAREEALEILQHIPYPYTVDPYVQVQLGDAFALLQKSDKALHAYQWALAHLLPLNPESTALIKLRMHLVRMQRFDLMEILLDLRTPHPSCTSPWCALVQGLAFLQQKKGEEALYWLRQNSLSLPDYLQGMRLVWISRAAREAGNWSVARAAAEDAARYYSASGKMSSALFWRYRADLYRFIQQETL